MNYQWHYDRLIETRKSRQRIVECYYEKHHITMRSMGGDNSIENLVYLTAREHFLAHWLLWMIYKPIGGKFARSAAFAFSMMNRSRKNQSRKILSAREYSFIREALSITTSLRNRDCTGNKNPMYGSKRLGKNAPNFGNFHTDESKLKISVAILGLKRSDDFKKKRSDYMKSLSHEEYSRRSSGIKNGNCNVYIFSKQNENHIIYMMKEEFAKFCESNNLSGNFIKDNLNYHSILEYNGWKIKKEKRKQYESRIK